MFNNSPKKQDRPIEDRFIHYMQFNGRGDFSGVLFTFLTESAFNAKKDLLNKWEKIGNCNLILYPADEIKSMMYDMEIKYRKKMQRYFDWFDKYAASVNAKRITNNICGGWIKKGIDKINNLQKIMKGDESSIKRQIDVDVKFAKANSIRTNELAFISPNTSVPKSQQEAFDSKASVNISDSANYAYRYGELKVLHYAALPNNIATFKGWIAPDLNYMIIEIVEYPNSPAEKVIRAEGWIQNYTHAYADTGSPIIDFMNRKIYTSEHCKMACDYRIKKYGY